MSGFVGESSLPATKARIPTSPALLSAPYAVVLLIRIILERIAIRPAFRRLGAGTPGLLRVIGVPTRQTSATRSFSEIILLGIDLPATMDAPLQQRSGRAVWYSFGILVANAAAIILQIDPGELQVGVRAVRRGLSHRLHGEVFLYDDVPGGAGYARAIEQNMKAILEKALELGEHCENPSCGGACYHCMFDYRKQMLHPLLDRALGAALLRFVLRHQQPSLSPDQISRGADSLAEYARTSWEVLPGRVVGGHYFPRVLRDQDGVEVGPWVIHPLQARPTSDGRQAFLSAHGLRCAVHTAFDLERRPFWVLNHLVTL